MNNSANNTPNIYYGAIQKPMYFNTKSYLKMMLIENIYGSGLIHE